MDLNVGQAFKISGGRNDGIYRVIARNSKVIALAIIRTTAAFANKPGPRKNIVNENELPSVSGTSKVLFLKNSEFKEMIDENVTEIWNAEISNIRKVYGAQCKEQWEKRLKIMEFFLNPDLLECNHPLKSVHA